MALVPFISCMTGKVFVMTHVRHEYHIKVKKSRGAFKVIPTIPMLYYNGMLDSDLKESKDKRKLSYIQPKVEIENMTCKSIAI